MPKRIEWTPDKDEYLRTSATAIPPLSLNTQAKHLGVSHGSVAKRRKHLGIKSDHAGTKAAVEARSITAAERRATLEHRHLDRIEAILARLEASEFITILRGEGGVENEATVTRPPTRDERDLASSMTQHWAAIERIRRMDTNNGTSEAVSMLGGIAQAIADAAAQMPEDGPGT
ncbi:hypothetical protein [Demequina flava]|uniref:hypothetical protein n=1 Tax=Demequina flava TaxID=1095025 RepID=UPI000780E8E6|nr:hypothetical protein [Demequina flava]